MKFTIVFDFDWDCGRHFCHRFASDQTKDEMSLKRRRLLNGFGKKERWKCEAELLKRRDGWLMRRVAWKWSFKGERERATETAQLLLLFV